MVSRGDVFWANLEPKIRPVVILTRDPVADRIDTLVVAPVTTRLRNVPTEVPLDRADGMPKECVVSLDNVMAIDRSDLREQVTALSAARMTDVCRALTFALGCD